MNKESLILAVDFDGTIVTHDYPHIGEDRGAIETLKWVTSLGHRIMLWTMRDGVQLEDAVLYCHQQDIKLWAVNKNPGQWTWSKSNKQYANIYIDDAAIGCPLIYLEDGKAPYVDWKKVRRHLEHIFAGGQVLLAKTGIHGIDY